MGPRDSLRIDCTGRSAKRNQEGIMRVSLQDKVAVVTGAASGLGLAIAEGLATAGAAVTIADLNRAGGEQAVEQIVGQGGRAIFQETDVQRAEDVRQLMSATVERWGSLDILVNNAGLQHIAPVAEFPEERWNTLVGVMLTGSFLCTKYALPTMMERKWGRIINMASIHGKVASAFKSAYVSSKFGIRGLTRVTAMEGAPYGITVNTICPSYVRTPLVEKQIASQAEVHGIPEDQVITEIMLADAAIKRILEPEEIADVALFLCSDSAAGITGSDIVIDCGWTAH
jgi:3-hydroxybutyrate dehydrogenase